MVAMTTRGTTRDDVTECWFCRRPVGVGERANRAPLGRIAVHVQCLRDDARHEGDRPAMDSSLRATA
jgi:hypothetical protein